MEHIADPSFVFEGEYDDYDVPEMMAEISKFYVMHNAEFKQTCPECYEFFERYVKSISGEVTYSDSTTIIVNDEEINLGI